MPASYRESRAGASAGGHKGAATEPEHGAIGYDSGMAATSMKELASEAAVDVRESGLYNKDFWSWTQEQAGALRRRDFGAVDWNNVIEEIEALGRSEESAWAFCCTNVVSHLLMIHHSPSSPDLNHWRNEIEDWRARCTAGSPTIPA